MFRRWAPPAVLLLLLVVSVVVVACSSKGGGEDTAGASSSQGSPSASPAVDQGTSPDPTPSASVAAGGPWFVTADTDAVNAVATQAQRSGATALATRRLERCNATSEQGYAAWRACWHRLLDPLARDLSAVAARMGAMSEQDLPPACTEALGAGQRRFTGFEQRVARLLDGIDNEQRRAQVRAMRTYDATLRGIGEGFAPVFRSLTQVCYSPSDLASINADPSSSPSSGSTASASPTD
ncbi:hypothetical protein SAMN04488570_0814 [Nocardioides scoriae]|uniref:DUF4142 domain-containing protein n=1 Tax=Nocardioides scoriae TaxID=642780 RepID=A0A1H1NA56_9ACTN|nr:hypothetical protein [Nocardioides scoriae]SDR95843.1 hypothetical protein SAMN04488570_0814 [Nocardioides scoriae]